MADDLATVRGRLRGNVRYARQSGSRDVRTLLAAYDEMAARLAAWDQHQCPQYKQHHQSRLVQLRRTIAERDTLAARLAAVERERDQARAEAADAMMAHGLAVESLRHVEALSKRELAILETRDRRLAALEAAARAWAAEYEGFLAQPPGVDLPTLEAGIQALLDAVAALDTAKSPLDQ